MILPVMFPMYVVREIVGQGDYFESWIPVFHRDYYISRSVNSITSSTAVHTVALAINHNAL